MGEDVSTNAGHVLAACVSQSSLTHLLYFTESLEGSESFKQF